MDRTGLRQLAAGTRSAALAGGVPLSKEHYVPLNERYAEMPRERFEG